MAAAAAAVVSKIDVEYVRNERFPKSEEELEPFISIVCVHAVDLLRYMEMHPPCWPTASNDVEREVQQWKKWATAMVRGTAAEKKSATWWFQQGEGNSGIINVLDVLRHSVDFMEKEELKRLNELKGSVGL